MALKRPLWGGGQNRGSSPYNFGVNRRKEFFHCAEITTSNHFGATNRKGHFRGAEGAMEKSFQNFGQFCPSNS